MVELFSNKQIKIALLGMVSGNGHPYSWGAIFNGYDPNEMGKCPYPVIPGYLGKEPPDAMGIPDARVTHIWTDDPEDAVKVASACMIPNVVAHPEEVIGCVDAVIIPTDKGDEHVDRCRPFVEAGLPVFVDKPLVDSEEGLRTFREWVADGKPILSSSCMRYCKEFMPYRASTHDLGELRYISITTPKSWERYGIHALEGVYPILGPGFVSARTIHGADRDIVHFSHSSGASVVVGAIADMYGAFCTAQLCGTAGHANVAMADTFFAFKSQLEAFVQYLRDGVRPFPWEETEELMKMLIAGIRSRDNGGREVVLSEIELSLGCCGR